MSRRRIKGLLERSERLLERIGDEDELTDEADEERIALLHQLRGGLAELESNGGDHGE